MMFIRFTDKSRRSVQAAFEEARVLGHDSVGDEDLLGILGNEDGTAVRMLDHLGVSTEALEDRLYQLRGRAAG